MKFGHSFGGAIGAACLALAWTIGSANAVTISMEASVDGGGFSPLADSDPSPSMALYLSAFSGPLGTFTGDIISGSGTPSVTAPTLLSSSAINVQSIGPGLHTLDILITSVGNVFPTGGFASGFASNAAGAGLIVSEKTYIDLGNGAFALTTLLGSADFPPLISAAGNSTFLLAGPAPYSLTALYHIEATGPQTSNASISIAAVPGPIVGAGIPGLLAACGGLIALARRRRKADQA